MNIKSNLKAIVSSCLFALVGMSSTANAGLISNSIVNAVTQSAEPGFSLTVLHINDHHSHLEADTGANLDFADVSTRVEMGGFPRVITKMRELESQGANILKVHAGDAITGTLLYSVFKGEADAAMMNEACFDVFAPGNHEFDGGDEGLALFLDYLAAGDCGTEVVAANIVPEIGTPLAPVSAQDYLAPYAVIDFDGESVGVIGIDIANKTMNSSSPLDTTQFLDEAETAQYYIDELEAEGVDKIVLVTHYQYANDVELAANLSGVDIIVGGDSHSLLGDFEAFGLNSAGSYPTETTDMNGNKVCIVQAWQYAYMLGELNVDFDRQGGVSSCEGTPHLLLGDSFKRRPPEGGDRVELEGADLEEVLSIIDGSPLVSVVEQDAAAVALLDTFTTQVDEFKDDPVGVVEEDLCLERIPGQGRSQICDVSATAGHGGDIQQMVAYAFLNRSFVADIALQNSGGVRIDIPAGTLTVGDVYTLLPFSNTMIEMVMSGEEIRQSVEEGVDFATIEDGSTGAYPYAAGLRWDVDLSQPFGSRISNLEVMPKNSTEWRTLLPEDSFTVVVNSFMAGGGDGYATLESISDDATRSVVDTYIDYAQGFIDYVVQDLNGSVSKLPLSEYSTQNFYDANGELQQ